MSLPSPNIIWLNSSSDEAIVIDNTIVVTEQVLSNPSGIPVTAVSNLTITTILKTHEANYTCIANNDVENLLGTPEDGTIPVIVQGTIITLICWIIIIIIVIIIIIIIIIIIVIMFCSI